MANKEFMNIVVYHKRKNRKKTYFMYAENKVGKKIIKDFELKDTQYIKNKFKKSDLSKEDRLTSYYSQKLLKDLSSKHKKQTGEKYIPTSKKELKTQIASFTDIHKDSKYIKHIKTFRTSENRVLYSNKQLSNINFTYAYINVKVKVYLNGYFVYSFGRSDLMKRHIKKYELEYHINKAIKRAIAPFGSNVKFKPVEWTYAYKQNRRKDFDKLK